MAASILRANRTGFLLLVLLPGVAALVIGGHKQPPLEPDAGGVDDDECPLQLLNIDRFPHARCLDGSPGGYYIRPTTAERSLDKWVIHLQGGGECASAARCSFIARTALGCSILFPDRHSFRGDNVHFITPGDLGAPHPMGPEAAITAEHSVLQNTDEAANPDLHDWNIATTIAEHSILQNTDAAANPDFHDWNMVFVPYCSQDLWTGRRKRAAAETFELHFSGAHIIEALMETLGTRYGMQNATDIIFSGTSAGGYGVHHHVDAVAAQFPAARAIGLVVGALWGFSFPYQGVGRTADIFASFREPNWHVMRRLWLAEIPEECSGEHPDSQINCLVGCSALPFSWMRRESRVFFAQMQTDSVMLIYHNWLPPPPIRLDGVMDPQLYLPPQRAYAESFGRNMTACLKRGLKQLELEGKDTIGIYSPACFLHTNFDDRIKIEGKSLKRAFTDFALGRPSMSSFVEEGFLTNPSCVSDEYQTLN